jgi:retron-type reverse transcriptase
MPYNWIIEGDIKGCFDNINHHHLMDRLRTRVADRRVVGLVGKFLKAGVLAEDQFLRTDNGTPQGGIISPLLANIALSAIEERYERWTYHRSKLQDRRLSDGAAAARGARGRDHKAGRGVFFPIRYADDFVVLVSGTEEDAIAEKEALANYLRQTTGLELSPEKTKITPVTEGFEFLGFHVAMRWDTRYGYFPRVEIPKAKAADLRHKIKVLATIATAPERAKCSRLLTGS